MIPEVISEKRDGFVNSSVCYLFRADDLSDPAIVAQFATRECRPRLALQPMAPRSCHSSQCRAVCTIRQTIGTPNDITPLCFTVTVRVSSQSVAATCDPLPVMVFRVSSGGRRQGMRVPRRPPQFLRLGMEALLLPLQFLRPGVRAPRLPHQFLKTLRRPT